jgi:hypothetical protein
MASREAARSRLFAFILEFPPCNPSLFRVTKRSERAISLGNASKNLIIRMCQRERVVAAPLFGRRVKLTHSQHIPLVRPERLRDVDAGGAHRGKSRCNQCRGE